MSTPDRPPGSIDFEPIDLDEARRVLDLPPDGLIDATQSAAFWLSRRRKPTPTDRALTGATIDWLVQLPADARPTKLCDQFPRIANALAEAWPDPVRGDGFLAALASGRRGQRKGFAQDLQLEIERLRVYRASGR